MVNTTKLVFYVFNIVMLIIGVGMAGIGIWMNSEYDVKAYMYVFGARPDGNWLHAASGIFIAAGFILAGNCLLGIFGAKRESKGMLGFYLFLLIFIIILELTAGFLMAALRNEFHRFVKTNMMLMIKNEYTWDNEVGLAWNRVQVKRRCCGVDGSWNFRCSDWWFSQPENSGIQCPDDYARGSVHVPNTCCVLERNQNLDPWRVDPQNAQPANIRRCQEDAEGEVSASSNVHERGCFTAMQDFIFTYIYILLGFGIITGLVQVVGVVMGCCVMRALKREPAVFGSDTRGPVPARKIEYSQPARKF